MNDKAQRVFDAELDRILPLIKELTAKVDYLRNVQKQEKNKRTSKKLCKHDRCVKDRICQDCGSVITYVPDHENMELEFEVEEVSSTVENNHGFLKLKLPYGYSKIEGILSKGDKVTVSFTIPF
ncbi:MAG: hypothetical protein KBD83_09455 [Gammaproteobacteria bacterium]|nr:hypothetical protein [Gammaproteobacteria bacterium]